MYILIILTLSIQLAWSKTNSMVMVTATHRVGSEEMGPDRIAQRNVPRTSSIVEIKLICSHVVHVPWKQNLINSPNLTHHYQPQQNHEDYFTIFLLPPKKEI